MDHSHDKVVWLEGMFLSPQHFQQQERYLKSYIHKLASMLDPDRVGFAQLHIDTDQLKAGKICLRTARGLFPDGTPFALEEDIIRDIQGAPPGLILYLAIPLIKAGHMDTTPREKACRTIRTELRLGCKRQQ